MVANVSAFSVLPPPAIAAIRDASGRRQLSELREKAQSAGELRELVELFALENAQLKSEATQLQEELVQTQLKYVYALYNAQVPTQSDTILPSEESDDERPPKRDEVRYYKKTFSKDTHDVLVKVTDCGHNNWEGAAKGDKAKKCIEKREKTKEWQNVWHCASCKGGGMWKVRW